jgi:gluconate 5-dehydrogenase
MHIPHPFSLQGKTALVAGASRGIGLAIAQQLAAAGARTVLAARSLPALEEEADKLRSQGHEAEVLRLDVSDYGSISAAVEKTPEVDIFVAVSGMNIRKRFEAYTPDDYEKIMQTNLHGFVRMTQQVGAGMIARGNGGKVIFIGSLTSVVGLPYLSIYGMSKSALAELARCLAVEWAPHNIQVNCIAPGFILTDINRDMWEHATEMKDWLWGSQAAQRMGTPEDVAPLALFLSSRGADYITGQVIAVDGGFLTTANWPFRPQ